jgi:thymidylate synthase
MKEYLDIVDNILTKGKWKKPTRRASNGTEVILPYDTLALPNQLFSHDMENGFPLLTTKKMPLRTVLVELEGFIKGITSKRWYQERGCKIWNEWSNPTKVEEEIRDRAEYEGDADLLEDNELKLRVQRELDDLGPIYGYQWRRFGQHYGSLPTIDYCGGTNGEDVMYLDSSINGLNEGTDQLKQIVDRLHNNPYDRRMVCSAWNPNQIDQMALPPCHYAWNVTVIGDTISLFWAQRSCDLMLGVPFNITSYASLLLLLAKESGFKPGNLSGMLVDCHIYSNHIDTAKQQLERQPRELPILEILGNPFNIFEWTHKDVTLTNYNPHDKLSFGEVTV